MNPKLLADISTAIHDATHRPFTLRNSTSVGGGCINEAYQLEGIDSSRYFLKLNDAQHLTMFVAEAQGLATIAATNTIRVPHAIAHGSTNGQSYLVLEHLELGSRGDAKLLGEQLAALHRCTSEKANINQNNPNATSSPPPRWGRARERVDTLPTDISSRFGFAQDTFIGTTPQPNTWTDDWVAFWR